MGVQAASNNYMQAIVERAQQKQSRVFLDLMNVQRSAVEVAAKPLRPIGPSGGQVDVFA